MKGEEKLKGRTLARNCLFELVTQAFIDENMPGKKNVKMSKLINKQTKLTKTDHDFLIKETNE
jgi:hypothetical protein